MNSNDYKRIMAERNLVTTIQAEDYLQHAKILQKSINNLKNMRYEQLACYQEDLRQKLVDLEKQKSTYIKLAINVSKDKSEVDDLETYGYVMEEYAKVATCSILEKYRPMSDEEIQYTIKMLATGMEE